MPPASDFPTLETLTALVGRILALEAEIAAERRQALDAEIERLKARIGALDGDAFELIYRELESAVRRRRGIARDTREDTFRLIAADESFPPRRFLSLIAREIPD